ncbi:BTAD domain-containing putative transcriptional regulator [Catenuloplanes sp. NPDC051500]|uniref:AfsR/SARP family transcriptional regulator n=1 Tax=Catenuloplanes sp. NPDC051500 TaxID=3363959 RepID=UPI0037B7F587
MDIRLLGPVEIRDGLDRPVPLARAGQRCVLAALALQPGRLIGTDALIRYLWGDKPPAKAGDTLASYTRAVRNALITAGADTDVLNRRLGGYELHVPPEQVDYHRFAALVRDAAREPSPAVSVEIYKTAASLWRGDPLAGLSTDWAADTAQRLTREYLHASCLRLRRQLESGAHAEAAAGVAALLTETVPTDEIIMIGMEALAHAGRHAEIDRFVANATSRMWDLVEARPGEAVRARAAQLIADPPAAPRPPHESSDPREERGGQAQLTAINCGTVFIAGGDQIISFLRHR